MERDDETISALVAELEQHGPLTLVMRPQSVLHLCGLLQLALRHPRLSPPSQHAARFFLDHARAYFTDCPTVLDVLRRGDDPHEDS